MMHLKLQIEVSPSSATWFENSTVSNEVIIDHTKDEDNDDDDEGFKGLVQVFRVFKLARILKLARFTEYFFLQFQLHFDIQALKRTSINCVYVESKCS